MSEKAEPGVVFSLVRDLPYREMRVTNGTDFKRLAGAIASEWENGYATELLVMGRDATYIATKAIPVANGHLIPNGVMFFSEVTWSKRPMDPWVGYEKTPALHGISKQTYQFYREGSSDPVRNERGDTIRIHAPGPHAAQEMWEKHPSYESEARMQIIKTLISIRLVPVRRGDAS